MRDFCFWLLAFCAVFSGNAEVFWKVDTNSWPEKLWVYKVVPQQFSPVVISNLLSIGGFTESDKRATPDFMAEYDKTAVFYGNHEGRAKYLLISPALGLIHYRNDKAESSSQLQKIEGVPTEPETTRLGLQYLRLLGVDISQIARKENSPELDLHWEKGTITYTDQTTQKEIVLTNTYGIMFNRAIDGVKVQGFGRGGGVRVRFGNNATVAEISICWRNLTPYQLKDCWSVQEIEEQILNGKIVLHPLGTTVEYPIKQLKKLTVTKATPRYEGKYLDEPMDFVRPYANFEGIADDGQTTTGVWFECSTLCK